MARRGREITVVGFMRMPDGSTKPMEELTQQELEDWDRRRVLRTSRVMSDVFFNQFPEQLQYVEEVSPERAKAFLEKFPEFKEKNRRNKATAS